MNNFIIIRQILFFLLRHRGGDNYFERSPPSLLLAGGWNKNKLPRGFIDRGFVQFVATDIAEFNGASVILWRVKNAVPFR